MNLSFQDTQKAERVLVRAVSALGGFANDDDRSELEMAQFLVAEMRFAAMTLCDATATMQMREEATERLTAIFKLDGPSPELEAISMQKTMRAQIDKAIQSPVKPGASAMRL